MILIDSSIYIAHLRAGRDPAEEFAPHALKHDLATCGLVRCEILRGIRERKALDTMRSYLDCLLYVPTLNHVWEQAEKLLWQLDRSGTVIPTTDAIIAACAIKADGAVLTHDKHFKAIPGLRVFEEFPD